MMSVAFESVSINWEYVSGRKCLVFKFCEMLTQEIAEEAIANWISKFNASPERKKVLIFDCSAMKDYHPIARVRWQRALRDQKDQIDRIILVSESPYIIAGAQILCIFSTVPIKVVESKERVYF